MKELTEQLINEYGISRHEANSIIDALFKNITQKIFFEGKDIIKHKMNKPISVNNLQVQRRCSSGQ